MKMKKTLLMMLFLGILGNNLSYASNEFVMMDRSVMPEEPTIAAGKCGCYFGPYDPGVYVIVANNECPTTQYPACNVGTCTVSAYRLDHTVILPPTVRECVGVELPPPPQ